MSKLLKQYNKLKSEDESYIYIFRSGIFYVALNEDAKILNEKIGFKLLDLSPEIIKCGFPVSQIDKYSLIMDNMKLRYKIIDNLPKEIPINEYLKNVEIRKILNEIIDVNLDTLTAQQAYFYLYDIQQKLKNIIG